MNLASIARSPASVDPSAADSEISIFLVVTASSARHDEKVFEAIYLNHQLRLGVVILNGVLEKYICVYAPA